MSEIWKPVVGYENCYSVSNFGNCVRTSLTRKRIVPNWRPVAGTIKKTGYVSFHLYQEKVGAYLLGHRMVWEAFNGPIPCDMQINHKNGIKFDNRLSNLELCTPSENTRHAYRILGKPAPNNPSYGVKNGSAKLTEDQVVEIRRLYATGKYRQKDIGAEFGVSQRTISLITRNEHWRHV